MLQHRVHGGVAYAATAAYLGNFGLRCYTGNRLTPLLVTLSVAGAILVGVTGYLGGELRNVM